MATQQTLAPDVRGVLIPVTDNHVLLPNACVSEVITYGTPQAPSDSAESWVLGISTWRGWRMPLFSFGQMVGGGEPEEVSGAKVAVLKAFSGVHRMPYMAMLTQGYPKLRTLTADEVELDGDQEGLPRGILYRVKADGETALIPDLPAIERHLLELVSQPAQAEDQY